MSGPPISAEAFIRREARVSMAINAMISLAFYLLIFGRTDPVPVWGMSGWIADFVPQGFMVALMGTAVPGAIAARKRAAGAVEPFAGSSSLPRSPVLRALLLAFVGAASGTAIVAAVAWLVGLASLPGWTAGALKVAYGAMLAGLVTPRAIAAALSQPQSKDLMT